MAHTLAASNQYPDSNTTTNTASTVNFAVTVAANATVLALGIITGGANARAGNAPNINGTNFSQANAAQKAATSPEVVAEMWYLLDPPTGNVTIAIPNTSNNATHSYLAQFAAAANFTSVLDTANGANATSTNPTVSLTTSANGAAAAMVAGSGLANCITGFSNQSGTSLYKSDVGAYGGGMQYVLQANAGNLAISYTANSDDWGAVAVAFREVERPKFALTNSANIAANGATNTTGQLTAPANKTANNFQAGKISDDTNPLPSLDLGANAYTELEWCLASSTYVANAEVYTFRVTVNGTAVNTYAANATWTIGDSSRSASVTQTLEAATPALTGAVAVAATATATLSSTTPTITTAVGVRGLAGAIETLRLSFEAGESWTGGTEETTTVSDGLRARTLVSDGVSVSCIYTPASPFDLSTTDTIAFDVHVSDPAHVNTTVTQIYFGDGLGNHVYACTASQWGTLAAGWNAIRLPRSAFSVVTGSPDWASIPDIRFYCYSTGGEVTLTFDNVRGSYALPLAAVTVDATGTVEDQPAIEAAVDHTLASAVIACTAGAAVTGGVAHSLAAATGQAAATVTVGGTVTHTLAAASGDSTATVAVAADVQQGLADASLAAAATVSLGALVSQTLADTTVDASAALSTEGEVSGSVDAELGAVTAEAAGTVAVSATVEQSLAAASVSAPASVAVAAATSQTLAVTGATATATVTARGVVSSQLAAATIVATGTARVSGAVASTLGTSTITANATVGTTSPIRLYPSSYIAANGTANTAGRLTPPANKTVNADFQAGLISDDTNPLPSLDLVTNRYTEVEWSLQATAFAVNAATYQFRVTANGTALTTYAVTPTWLYRTPIEAAVTQTLADVICTATAEPESEDTRYAVVSQTLQPVTVQADAVSQRAADVTVTLGSISDTRLFLDTSAIGGGTPTGFNLYFGRVSTLYTQIVSVPYEPNLEVVLRDVAPDTGEWYVMARAYNNDGETPPSNEVFVVVPTFTATVETLTGVGSVTQTLSAVSRAIAGRVQVRGATTQTLDTATHAVAGTVGVQATVSSTLATASTDITAASAVAAALTQPLASASVSVAAAVRVSALVDAAIAAVACTADGLVYSPGTVFGEVDATLNATSAHATVAVGVGGAVSQTLGVTSHAATGAVRASGEVSQTLAGVACDADGAVHEPESNTGWVDQLLEDAHRQATGAVAVRASTSAALELVAVGSTAFIGLSSRKNRQRNTLLDGSTVRCS